MHARLHELMANAGVPKVVSATAQPTGFSAALPSQIGSVASSDADLGSSSHADSVGTIGSSSGSGMFSDLESLFSGGLGGLGSLGSLFGGGSASSGSSGGGIGSLLGGLLGGGGLIGDAISGIASLFGGGSSAPTFTQYQAPDQQQFDLADSGGQLTDASYDAYGAPRSSSLSEPGLTGVAGLNAATAPASALPAPSSAGSSSGQTISVNVQAMDSQSFMDRSADIASAVRSAMLNMSSINDVINDL
jgi:hypothetical protein